MTTEQIPKKPEEFKHWVEYQLKLNRASFASVARLVGVSRQAIRKSVATPSERVADALASTIGIPKKRLWPKRFAA